MHKPSLKWQCHKQKQQPEKEGRLTPKEAIGQKAEELGLS